MRNLPRVHWPITVAAWVSLLALVLIAVASRNEWIPRSIGAVLYIAWAPVMVALVLSSRILGNIRLTGGASDMRGIQRGLVASVGGLILALLILVAMYVMSRLTG